MNYLFKDKPEVLDVRLPKHIEPSRYILRIIPYMDIPYNFTFDGHVEVRGCSFIMSYRLGGWG